jgi:hypothetical protein
MLFEPIDCTAEEARRNADACYERMCDFDKELKPLYERLHELEAICNNQYYEEECELRERIHILEGFADQCDRYNDYWLKQLEWAKQREAESDEVRKCV